MSDLTRLRAEVARAGCAPHQLTPYWNPDTDSMIDPRQDPEIIAEAFRVCALVWEADR